MQGEAEEALQEALPALEAARLALDELDKSDVTEIRFDFTSSLSFFFFFLLSNNCCLFILFRYYTHLIVQIEFLTHMTALM